MDQKMSALERAFQLAKSGQAKSVVSIVNTLRHEGYDIRQIHGGALSAQLRFAIKAARGEHANRIAT